MRELASAIILIIGFLLQSTVFSQFPIGGTIPNILIIIVSSIGFIVNRKYGMIVGFFAGLLTDIFFGSIIGIYALMFMYIGYLCGFFKKILFTSDFKLPLVLIGLSDFVYGHLYYIIFFLIKGDFQYTYYLLSVILPETIYTTAIAFLLYPLLKKLFEKVEKYEERIENVIE